MCSDVTIAAQVRQRLAFMQGNVRVLTVTQALILFALNMTFPYASLYVLSLGGGATQIGWVNALAPLAGLIALPLGGYLADHGRRVPVLVFTGLYGALVYLAFALAPSWQVIAVAALFLGFMGVQNPPTSAILADALSPEERGKGIATMNAVSGLLATVAPYLAGALIVALGATLGMRLLYGWITVSYVVVTLLRKRFLCEPAQVTTQIDLAGLRQALKAAYSGIPAMLRQLPTSLRALALVVTLGFVSNAVAGPFWVVYAVQQIGLSPTAWGLILLVETVLRNLAYVPAGVLVDRLGRRGPLLASLAVTMVSVPLFAWATGFWGVLAIRAVVAVASALFIPACSALMADTVPRDMRGRVMAALGSGGVLLGAAAGGTGGPGLGFMITLPLMVASVASGYIYAWDPRAPWLFTMLALALALGVMLLWVREPQAAEV